MSETIEELLAKPWIGKENFLKLLDDKPADFDRLLEICLTDHKPQAWRAAWLIRHKILTGSLRLFSKGMRKELRCPVRINSKNLCASRSFKTNLVHLSTYTDADEFLM